MVLKDICVNVCVLFTVSLGLREVVGCFSVDLLCVCNISRVRDIVGLVFLSLSGCDSKSSLL